MIIQWLEDLDAVVGAEACGSRITCNPAPTGTDQDYLVELNHGFSIDALLQSEGFMAEGSDLYDGNPNTFTSYRRADVNLIVSDDPEFCRLHRAATYVCKRLNLMDKDDRISVFQAVLYGNCWNLYVY